jgi:hypothetical protein
VYDGYWRDDKRHGEGILISYADGILYEGNWKDDNPNRKSFAKRLVRSAVNSAIGAAVSAAVGLAEVSSSI